MNTKFKKGNIVKSTSYIYRLRIYRITGLSDTGYYMKNILTGTPLGYDPDDRNLIPATVEDVLKAHCYEEIMFDNSRIDECIKAYKAQVDFSIHWSDRLDDYPTQLLEVQSFDFGSFVSEWISDNSELGFKSDN